MSATVAPHRRRLQRALADLPLLRGRAALLQLLRLLSEGCHSELELWGHAHVFDHPSLPRAVAQRPLRLGKRVVYLDRGYEREMVDVELDGAAYHSSRAQRERDIRRDAAVARRGWLPVRFSHARLHEEPDGARAELRDILAVRRRQLGGTR